MIHESGAQPKRATVHAEKDDLMLLNGLVVNDRSSLPSSSGTNAAILAATPVAYLVERGGLRVSGFGCWVTGVGCWVLGVGCRV